jgi:hypothetical protein
MSISLYCNCYRNKINKKTEYNQKNLMLGSISYDPKLKSELFLNGFIFDDTGDNISHLNYWFGQLTGLYWTWKNTDEEIIGTNTYRLFWGDYFLDNNFESNTLYISNPMDVRKCVRQDANIKSIYDHYEYCHGTIGLKLLKKLANTNKISLKPEMIDNLKNDYLMYSFNMFLSERKIFDKICTILFDILFEFFSEYKNQCELLEQKRILDFLSERVLHTVYKNIDYFLPEVKISTVSTIHLNH